MSNLFIFGAGASKKSGAPLMREFLDKSDELHRGGLQDGAEAFSDVLRALSDLQVIHAKSYLDLDNIEAVFSAIEMGQLVGQFPNRAEEEVQQLRSSIITVIVKTLERSVKFPVSDRGIRPPEPYDQFGKALTELTRSAEYRRDSKFSFMTFNYDLGLDYALHYHSQNSTYWLPEDRNAQRWPLLKLHGSINWGRCNECGVVVPRYVHEANFQLWSETKNVHFDLGSKISHKEHCGQPLSGPPVIVPPTWNKSEYHGALTGIWRKAAQELGAAENIFVVGYSLPETDYFFRYLFALGTASDTRIKRLWVINPDPDGTVEERFRTLVGRGIESRLRFINGDAGRFENAIGRIQGELMNVVHNG